MLEVKNQKTPQNQQNILLQIARKSIQYGLKNHSKLKVDLTKYPDTLSDIKACFVTLNKNNKLRGCIGTLIARNPLIQEVADSAYAAAFLDYRFSKVTPDELEDLDIHISILTDPQPMTFNSEQDLIAQLRPGKDGLIFKVGNMSGTFLPSVWEQLPNPTNFLCHLKNKAGLASDYWSDQVEVFRYETDSFGD